MQSFGEVHNYHLQYHLTPAENASGFTLFAPKINSYAELFSAVPKIITSADNSECSAKNMLIQEICEQKRLLNEKGLKKWDESLDRLLQTLNSQKLEETSADELYVMEVLHNYPCF